MSEQQYLWNSLDGGENVFIKESGSDKIIHIKIIEGKHEFVDFMKKVNEQQATITHLDKVFGKNFAKRRLLERDNLVLRNENEQLKVLLKEAEEEIDRLKKSNQGFMEALVNNESENEDNQETEVRECQFCGEFRTEYHEYEDYSWSAEDYCNAGHYLEDTDPNTCKDYWDK